ncbi:hypothetical protein GGI09_007172 [Coemansia sp. S100]|nr:hypothetical protein GGI09_007172 [Coemansia sp. S100]
MLLPLGTALADTATTTLTLPVSGAAEAKLVPHGVQGAKKTGAHSSAVARTGSNAQTLLAHRDSRVVDALHINVVLIKQHIRRHLGALSVTHKNRHNVRGIGHDGNAGRGQIGLELAHVGLLQVALALRLRQVLDASNGASIDGRRQRGGKDKARRVGADHVDQGRRGGNIATDNAKRLSKSASDNVDLVHQRAGNALAHGRS